MLIPLMILIKLSAISLISYLIYLHLKLVCSHKERKNEKKSPSFSLFKYFPCQKAAAISFGCCWLRADLLGTPRKPLILGSFDGLSNSAEAGDLEDLQPSQASNGCGANLLWCDTERWASVLPRGLLIWQLGI